MSIRKFYIETIGKVVLFLLRFPEAEFVPSLIFKLLLSDIWS